jgi:hypothetical protein
MTPPGYFLFCFPNSFSSYPFVLFPYLFVLIVQACAFVFTVQHTNIHAPSGIRTRNLRNQAAADPRLRVKTNKKRGGAERPAACDLICGNKSTAFFHELNHKLLAAPLDVCFYPSKPRPSGL